MNTQARQITAAPGIIVIDQALDVDDHLAFARSEQSWADARVGRGDGDLNTSLRACRVFGGLSPSPHNDDDPSWLRVTRAIWSYADAYGKAFDIGFSGMEPPQLLWYRPSEGFYGVHQDDGPQAPRVISAVLYLNDVEEGGETYFPHFDVAVMARKGRLVLFPSNFAYAHEARPPVSGPKYAVVTWFTPLK